MTPETLIERQRQRRAEASAKVTITEAQLGMVIHDLGIAWGAVGLDATLALSDILTKKGDEAFLTRCFTTGVRAGKHARGAK